MKLRLASSASKTARQPDARHLKRIPRLSNNRLQERSHLVLDHRGDLGKYKQAFVPEERSVIGFAAGHFFPPSPKLQAQLHLSVYLLTHATIRWQQCICTEDAPVCDRKSSARRNAQCQILPLLSVHYLTCHLGIDCQLRWDSLPLPCPFFSFARSWSFHLQCQIELCCPGRAPVDK